MLDHWVIPVPDSTVQWAQEMPDGFFGRKVVFSDKLTKQLPKGGVLLVGLDQAEANAVRKVLYQFAAPEGKVVLTDIGNFRKPDADFCIPLIQELLTAGHVVVLIGKKEDTAITQFLSYRDFKRVSNFAVLDKSLNLAVSANETLADPLQMVLLPLHRRLFHFCLIGSQSHLIRQSVSRYLEKKNFDLIRLGQLRSEMAVIEPAIRDMDLFAIRLGAIKNQFSDPLPNDSSSGLTVEEACQICRYAGLSEKITSVSFAGFQTEAGRLPVQADIVAQMVWYFCEGVAHRHGDFPVSTDQMTEYIVDLQKYGYRLTFWRSNKSGRWWVQVPVQIEKNKERHRLMPCIYQDYQSACAEELSERLINAFKRFM